MREGVSAYGAGPFLSIAVAAPWIGTWIGGSAEGAEAGSLAAALGAAVAVSVAATFAAGLVPQPPRCSGSRSVRCGVDARVAARGRAFVMLRRS